MSPFFLFFVFKQKTAYDMRISDWSSDVCSSDLAGPHALRHFEYLCAFVRPYAAGKPVRRIVRLGQSFFLRAERLHREHGAEDFLLHDAIRLGDRKSVV